MSAMFNIFVYVYVWIERYILQCKTGYVVNGQIAYFNKLFKEELLSRVYREIWK